LHEPYAARTSRQLEVARRAERSPEDRRKFIEREGPGYRVEHDPAAPHRLSMKETDAVVMTVCRRRFGQAKSSVLAAVYASHDQAIQALVSAIAEYEIHMTARLRVSRRDSLSPYICMICPLDNATSV